MASTGSNSSVQEAEVSAPRTDIVVALTSHNDVQTIAAAVRAVREGLARYFGSSDARIVLADAGSTDGTREAARDAAGTSPFFEIECKSDPDFRDPPYHGRPGRAAALRAVLETAHRAGAGACAVVDAGIHSIEPQWIERLVRPVIAEHVDYVSPYYPRHATEGAITKSIVYPMFRALYGVRLRQPAATEFGCSGRLVAHYLDEEFWGAEQASASIDFWLAVAAVCGAFRTCETALGPRVAALPATPLDLSTTLAQVVGAVFADVERRVDIWHRVRGSVAVPMVGTVPPPGPGGSSLDVDALIASFQLGYRELREVWTWVLPPRTIIDLRRLTDTALDRFRFDDRLWASIIYDFALGYAFHVLPRDHLLRSLTPLYSGWLASFVHEMRGAMLPQIEERVEQLCRGFESQKSYLISRWRWPERLR